MHGCHQYTGAASALTMVPGMRYMDPLVWAVDANRKSIKTALREQEASSAGGNEGVRTMMGMVPDGILGAFSGKAGIDELAIGRKRGLLRIGMEDGVTLYTRFFFF